MSCVGLLIDAFHVRDALPSHNSKALEHHTAAWLYMARIATTHNAKPIQNS